MAPRRTSNETRPTEPPPLQEIVFSCAICYALPSDVYASTESNKGFHSDAADESGIVTKFWISECSHVFCGRHLEDGAAPFHPHKHRPQAACPVCVDRDPNNNAPKELFGIRGLSPGQYDPGVPQEYFQCPPMRLNTNENDPNLDALKFQYSHISNYAMQVTKLWKEDRRRRRSLEKSVTKERQQWEAIQAGLSSRILDLEKDQAKLKKWEERKAMIHHYLGAVGQMSKDIQKMRSHLLRLGFDVPEQSYSFEDKHDESQQTQARNAEAERSYSSATLVGDKIRTSSSSLKRRHEGDHYNDNQETQLPASTSNAMMPPPLPLQQQPARSQRRDGQPTQSARQPLHNLSQEYRPDQGANSAYEAPAPRRLHQSLQHEAEILPTVHEDISQAHHQRSWPERTTAVVHKGRTRHDNRGVASNEPQVSTYDHEFVDPQPARPLPFRPPQFAAPPRHVQRKPESHEDVAAYVQQRSYLSNAATRRQEQSHYYTDAPEATFAPSDSRQAPDPTPRRQVNHFNPACGTMAQQSGDNVPRDMAPPFSQSRTAGPNSTTFQRLIVTPAQRRPGLPQQPVESVVSPFFKQSQRPGTVRPPARGMDSRPQQQTSPSRAQFPTQRPVATNHGLYTEARDQLSSSRGLWALQPGHVNTSTPFRRPGQTVQQPYALQNRFQNSAQSMAPPSSAHRNRMTLPPSSSRMAYNNGQDPDLSRIQGVRGGGFPAANTGRQNLATPVYGQPRGLYSAAESRRSVLR